MSIKKNVFFIIPICSIIFSFLIVNFSFSAQESQGSMTSYSTKPFDDDWKSLPQKYNGHDIVAVHKTLSKRFTVKKDEFETKEQFQQRVNNAWNKPIIGNMTGQDKFAFIQGYPEKQYDADNSQFIFTIKNWEGGGGIVIRNIRIGDNELGSEIARNEAKSIKRQRIMRGKSTWEADMAGALMAGVMKEAGINETYTIYIPDKDLSTVKQIVVDMPPNEARQANDNMRVLFICDIQGVSSGDANNDYVWSHHLNVLKVNLEKIIIFNYQTGKIYQIVYKKGGQCAFYNKRGYTYFNLGKYAEAIDDFNKAIELNPKFGIAYYNRGLVYNYLCKYDEAIDDFNKAIELDPNNYEAYYARARILSLTGHDESSIQELNKAIQEKPTLRNSAKTEKDFDNIRNNPNFKRLIGE